MLTSFLPKAVRTFAGRLRFPQLFVLAGLLFVVDLFIPDMIPMFDEVFFGLLTLLFGSWKERMDEKQKPELKDITPPDPPAGSDG